jgi:hypothetical protein
MLKRIDSWPCASIEDVKHRENNVTCIQGSLDLNLLYD